MIPIIIGTLLGLLCLATGARAQFQFFEQMFGGGQQQQESREHNVPSDSSWYQRTYDNADSLQRDALTTSAPEL
ncbi:long chronological lifespan protein 2 [Blastomyces percursus]|uniref:Long chronological lifespan protein 2 n=1 Tax=Blastomyces percursus TaxID=1658174 RepID=A0A1J9R3F0_9EURO|nr:long chronological lifespan protein 2 [Blastomyces percursus]